MYTLYNVQCEPCFRELSGLLSSSCFSVLGIPGLLSSVFSVFDIRPFWTSDLFGLPFPLRQLPPFPLPLLLLVRFEHPAKLFLGLYCLLPQGCLVVFQSLALIAAFSRIAFEHVESAFQLKNIQRPAAINIELLEKSFNLFRQGKEDMASDRGCHWDGTKRLASVSASGIAW